MKGPGTLGLHVQQLQPDSSVHRHSRIEKKRPLEAVEGRGCRSARVQRASQIIRRLRRIGIQQLSQLVRFNGRIKAFHPRENHAEIAVKNCLLWLDRNRPPNETFQPVQLDRFDAAHPQQISASACFG